MEITRSKNKREKRKNRLELLEIAKLYKNGYNLTEIGNFLGESKQTISYRFLILETEYPELLKEEI